MSSLLRAQKIAKTFYAPHPLAILQEINLEVLSGESIAIVGRSGEGKSTLLHTLGTLEEPSSGSLFIDSIEVSPSTQDWIRNQKIGFVFQSFHLLEDYSVIDNVLMPAKIARKCTKKGSLARERAYELLKRVGLQERSDFPAKFLSGGEKQRVALARALCNDPSLILADEPSGNLDGETAAIIHEFLLHFSQTAGKALLLVTHDKHLAKRCSKQYELKQGILYPLF